MAGRKYHMGGRIYDASMGRFLQADPIVQAPNNSQSHNRYAYVFNNPMTFTDPSGYSAWTKFRDKILRPVLAIVVGVYMPMFAKLAWGLGPIASGAITGFVAGGIATGSLRGAAVGALTGSLFGSLHGVGGSNGLWGHAMTGGIGSVLNGGKFGHGFFSAGFTKGMGGIFETATTTAQRMTNALKAAMIGGTVSKLTGGKFGNGAVTGAFSRLLNDDVANSNKKEEELLRYEKELTKNLSVKLGDDFISAAKIKLGDYSLEYDSTTGLFKGKLGSKYIEIDGGKIEALGLEAEVTENAKLQLRLKFEGKGINWNIGGQIKAGNWITKFFRPDSHYASGRIDLDLSNMARHNGFLSEAFDRAYGDACKQAKVDC